MTELINIASSKLLKKQTQSTKRLAVPCLMLVHNMVYYLILEAQSLKLEEEKVFCSIFWHFPLRSL